jgi:small multidrug resistance pump
MDKFLLVALGIILALLTSFGDGFIKKAALRESFSGWILLAVGVAIYIITAFGWFHILRRVELSSAVIIYTMSLILFEVFLGFFYFKEVINIFEMVGIGLALISLVLLARFA